MKKRKKVLCITRKYPPEVGGMENFCYHVFEGLDRNELDVKIIALGKKQIHLLWFFPYTVLYVLFHVRKYDVLFVGDSLLCYLGNVAKTVSKRVKVVGVVYGLDFLYSNPIYQLYLRMFFKKSFDEYVCISIGTKDKLKKWGISGTKIITPGIDIHKFDQKVNGAAVRKKYKIPKDNIILLTTGRLVKRKGVEWFVDHVLPELKDLPITYLIVGQGGEKENIQKAIQRNGLQKTALMLGRITDLEMLQCYKEADVFVMPNISVANDMEGFGIVAIEASLAGLLVLASGIEGIKDAVIDGKNGYLLESGNKEQYAAKIRDVVTNIEQYRKETESFSEYTKQVYSWKNICRQFSELIINM